MKIGDTHSSLKNLIVFEGIDGSGTTTQLKLLEKRLMLAGLGFVTTAEPTSRPEGQLVRSILRGELDADPGTVAYLFAADRHQHLHGVEGILSLVEAGNWVFCDRYVLSSLAYQGITCGEELPRLLNAPFPRPGLTLYFKVDPERSMGRVLTRSSLEIYEKLHMQKQFSAAYERLIEEKKGEGWNIALVDADREVCEVQRQVLDLVGAYVGLDLATTRLAAD